MRYTQLFDRTVGRFGSTVSLLVFQATAFLVPWFAVLWLSHTASINSVADFSLLLAIVAPLCLLLATPSRNFLLSGDEDVSHHTVVIRFAFSLLGISVIAAIGHWQGALLLAVALFVCKNGEFYYDIAIADLIKKNAKRALFLRAIRKAGFTLLGVVITFWSASLIIGLSVLGVLFVLDALFETQQKRTMGKSLSVAAQALPLSLNALVFSVYFYIPRYVLGGDSHVQELAVFTVSSFLIMVALIVSNAYCQSQLAHWRKQVASERNAIFMQSLYKTMGLLALLYIALQVFHLPLLASPFWQAHNNINLLQVDLMAVYHQTLWFAVGPILFSFANYLLIVTHNHRFLLVLTLLNTGLCSVLGWLGFYAFGFSGLIAIVACCGGLQFLCCFRKMKMHLAGEHV
ncbi:hypothetical protein DRW07_00065 [Alteromonas sediminis]|uniref:Polysaccharide biosynthesis protein n=1 Tax=Alteromonas sediminis TaxID=2259342 RepID=A0A3N5ZD44_9ALTE|nr:hypothetical protein [Alteromonas sediminis]RPJ67848.1 hypothetical protein DRW07_00065 [Alteromonas sediminis]